MNLSFKSYWNLLSDHIRPQKGRFILLAVLLFGSIGLRIFAPQIMRKFIDSALAGEALQTLTWTAIAFIGVALIQQAVAVSVTYLGENVAWTATNDLRAELAEHALYLDMKFHNDHTPGELIERIDGDVTELATFFSQFALEPDRQWTAARRHSHRAVHRRLAGRTGIHGLLDSHHRHPRSAQRYCRAASKSAARGRSPTVRLRRRATGWHGRHPLQRRSGLFHPRTVPPSGHHPRSQPQVAFQTLDHRKRDGLRADRGNLLAIASGYWLFSAGLVTIGTVYLFVHYINLLEEPFWAMTHEIESFQTIGACVERLTEFRNFKAEVVSGAGVEIPSQPLGVEL